jgi:hypothetical protein
MSGKRNGRTRTVMRICRAMRWLRLRVSNMR